MSEFSRSIHLFGVTLQQAVEQIRSAHISGAVVGANPFSATLLMDEGDLPRYIPGNPFPIVYYVYEADYGIWIHFYADGDHVASVTFDYDEEEGEAADHPAEGAEGNESGRVGIPYVYITPGIGEILAAARFLHPEQSKQAETVFRNFAQAWQENNREGIQEGIERTGEVLGLYAYRWLNEEEALSTPEELLARYPEAVIVNA